MPLPNRATCGRSSIWLEHSPVTGEAAGSSPVDRANFYISTKKGSWYNIDMFKKLSDFSYERNWKEAIGFYLAYLLLGIILGFASGFILGVFIYSVGTIHNFETNYEIGRRVGVSFYMIYILVIFVLLLAKKKMLNNFGYILLGLFNLILSVFGGAIFGLIIPAFITTRKTKLQSQPDASSNIIQ